MFFVRRFLLVVLLLVVANISAASAQDDDTPPAPGHLPAPEAVSEFLSEVFALQMTGCGVGIEYWYENYQTLLDGQTEPTLQEGFRLLVILEEDCGPLPDDSALQAWFAEQYPQGSETCGWEIAELYSPFNDDLRYGLDMKADCWLAGPNPAEVVPPPMQPSGSQA